MNDSEIGTASYTINISGPIIIVDSSNANVAANTTWGDGTSNITFSSNVHVTSGATLKLDVNSLNKLKGAGYNITVDPGSSIQIGNGRIKTVIAGQRYILALRP